MNNLEIFADIQKQARNRYATDKSKNICSTRDEISVGLNYRGFSIGTKEGQYVRDVIKGAIKPEEFCIKHSIQTTVKKCGDIEAVDSEKDLFLAASLGIGIEGGIGVDDLCCDGYTSHQHNGEDAVFTQNSCALLVGSNLLENSSCSVNDCAGGVFISV